MPVAVVVGGSAGLGRAVTRRLAGDGWDGSAVGEVAAELRHRRSRVRISQIDMPALDTPFYDWVENLMPRRSRPMPVAFEPEGSAVVAKVARQQSHVARSPQLPANLYETVPADVATRGVFGRESLAWSPQVWAVTHRRAASVMGLAAGAVAVGAVARRRRG